MRIVIDTNVLWVSIPRSSPSNWIVRDLLKNKFSICVTTDILEEYEEIINRFLGAETTNNFMEFLETLPIVEYITNYIRWKLITHDPKDDKFADCYLWGNAEYLVTNDHHFDVLKERTFPKINVINLEEFTQLMRK
jgi:uncharacterized protein